MIAYAVTAAIMFALLCAEAFGQVNGGRAAGGPPSGSAGGVLSGTYPNPDMAAGAAAANLGAAGGDLSGTYPSPTVAKVNGSTVGTMATQNANAVAITGGTIDSVTAGGTTPLTGITLNTANAVQWGTDLFLVRDAANVLAIYNSTNPQTFRIYGTRTDASNYEQGGLFWQSSRFTIGTSALGTGTVRSITIAPGGTQSWIFDTSGANYALRPLADASYNLGSSSTHVKHIYSSGVWLNNAIAKATPTTGQTVTVSQLINTQIIAPAGALAALTVQFPTPGADGHAFELVIAQTITALTLTPSSGDTISGGITAVTTYSSTRWRYYSADKIWYQVN